MMNVRVEGARVEARAMKRDQIVRGLSRPKALFLSAAGLSFLMSVCLFFTGSREQGLFVGIWVPSILSAGALLLAENRRE